jgi:hypothetical protein
MSWLGTIRPTTANDAFDPALWATFVSTTLGLGVAVLSSPRNMELGLAGGHVLRNTNTPTTKEHHPFAGTQTQWSAPNTIPGQEVPALPRKEPET